MKTNESEYKRLDNQLLSLMTRVHAFLKGRLTLRELGAAQERAEIFRTNQVTNYVEEARACIAAQLKQENAELRKDKRRLDWMLGAHGGDLQSRDDIDQAICHEHGQPSI